MGMDDAGRSSEPGGSHATTPWGKIVQEFLTDPRSWRRVSAHAEPATGRAYQGGASVEEVFEKAGVVLVRHRIFGAGGTIVHETFRPHSKFGGP
jgi:hypothetical protein